MNRIFLIAALLVLATGCRKKPKYPEYLPPTEPVYTEVFPNPTITSVTLSTFAGVHSVAKFYYDDKGRCVLQDLGDGDSSRYSYQGFEVRETKYSSGLELMMKPVHYLRPDGQPKRMDENGTFNHYTEYEYNKDGLVITAVCRDGRTNDVLVTWKYDWKDGNLVTQTLWNGTTDLPVAETWSYTYDLATENTLKFNKPVDLYTGNNKNVVLKETKTHSSGSEQIYSYTYQRDSMGRIVSALRTKISNLKEELTITYSYGQ